MTSLVQGYDGIVCDLDGVVYRGPEAVPHAVASLGAVAEARIGIAYATNNASRTPASVSEQLRSLGLSLNASQVVTSSRAGADRLLRLLGSGAFVLAVGGEGVGHALTEAGMVVVSPASAASGHPVAGVLQGYGPDVGWRDLAEAAYAVAGGAVWVATNDDLTLPTERGTAPGNGTLVGAVRTATGVEPLVVGKPHTPLYELSAAVLNADSSRTLAVGDRLDTDIAGANAAGMDSLLVLTGVSRLRDLVHAEPAERPTYVGRDLRALFLPYAVPALVSAPAGSAPSPAAPEWTCGQALVGFDPAGRLTGLDDGPLQDRLQAALAAIWEVVDGSGSPAGDVDAATLHVVAMVEAEQD